MPPIRFTRYGAPNPAQRPAPTPVKPAPSTPAAVAANLPAPAIIANELVTTPSVRKAYFVGQIIDPAHPELMYRPGVVYREEIPERWNRNPAANRGAVMGVIAAVPDSALLPPSSPEQQQMIAQQRRVMELLAGTNADLNRQLADAKASLASGVSHAAEAPTATPTNSQAPESPTGPLISSPAARTPPGAASAATAARGPVDLSRALVPNADGAIELSPEILDEVDRSEPNPFVKRYQAQTTYREVLVEVTGTSPGPRPTASVNGRLVNIGDSWEGFVVAAITRDAVYLQKDVFLLQIPLARQRGVTVRLPQ